MGYEIRVGPGGVANTQDIYNYLTGPKELGGYGYSTTSALGLMSNMQRESGFITNVTEYGGGPGIGLFQYTYPPRKAEFIAAVPDWQTNPKAQIDFALTGETTLGITGIPNSQLLQNIMNSDGDINTIQSQILSKWEIPKDLYGGATKNMSFARQIAGTLVDSDGNPLINNAQVLDQVSKAGTVSTAPVQTLNAQQRQDIENQISVINSQLNSDPGLDQGTIDKLLSDKKKLQAQLNGTTARSGSQSKDGSKGQIKDLKCNLPTPVGTNPLHDLRNYTYRIILSTLSRDEYNAFVSKEDQFGKIDSQVFPKSGTILISSGGEDLNKKNEYGVQDFYFSELNLLTSPDPGGSTGGDSKSVSFANDIDFTIVETLGTTLFERLFFAAAEGESAEMSDIKNDNIKKAAKEKISRNSRIADQSDKSTNVADAMTSYVFLLTIEFKGYKGFNSLKPGDKKIGGSVFMLDNTSNSGNFQKKYHIPFVFSSIDTDIDVKGTQYRCKATPAAAQVFFTLNQAMPVTSTIRENIKLNEALRDLSDRYTNNQKNLPKDIKKHTYKFRIAEDSELPKDDIAAKNIARELRNMTTFRSGPPEDSSRITFMAPKSDEQKKEGRISSGKSGTTSFRSSNDQAYHIGMGTTGIEIVHQIMLRTDFIDKQVKLAREGKAEDGIWWYNIRGNMLFDKKENSKNPHVEDGKIFEYIIEPYKVRVMNDMDQSEPCTQEKTFRNYEYIFTGKNNDILRWDLSYEGLLYTEMQMPEPSSTTAEMGQPGTNSGQAVNAAGQARGTNNQNKMSFPTLTTVNDKSQGWQQKWFRPNHFGVSETNADAGRVKKYKEMENVQFFESLFRQQTQKQQLELDIDIIGDPEYLSSFDQLTIARSASNPPASPVGTDPRQAAAEARKRSDTTKAIANKIAQQSNNEQYLVGLRFKTPTDIDPRTLSYKGMRAADLSGIYAITGIKHIFRNGKFIQQLHLTGMDNKCCPTPQDTKTKLKPTAGTNSKGGGTPGGTRPLLNPTQAPEGTEETGGAAGSVYDPTSKNPVPGSTVSSEFRGQGRPDHTGIDQAAPPGTPILAAFDGVVIRNDVQSGIRSRSGYGYYTMVQNNADQAIVLTAHQREMGIIPAGTGVTQGTQVANVGSTGGSDGPHSHTEVLVPPNHPLYNSPGAINSKISGYTEYRNINPRYYLNIK